MNIAFGDAHTMSGSAVGGNDTLVAGSGNDSLVGDALFMEDDATGGADVFVFLPGATPTFHSIVDFRQEDGDRIDVSAYGFTDLADMTIAATAFGSTTIELDSGDAVSTVFLNLFDEPSLLTADDFIFA